MHFVITQLIDVHERHQREYSFWIIRTLYLFFHCNNWRDALVKFGNKENIHMNDLQNRTIRQFCNKNVNSAFGIPSSSWIFRCLYKSLFCFFDPKTQYLVQTLCCTKHVAFNSYFNYIVTSFSIVVPYIVLLDAFFFLLPFHTRFPFLQDTIDFQAI